MSGSTNYDVVLRLRTEGELGTKLAELGQRAQAADAHVVHMVESFSRLGERAGATLEGIADKAAEAGMHLAKLGAAAVVAGATYGVVHLNRELEDTKMALAAISQAQGFTKTFGEGFNLAGNQLAKMKQDIKSLPGDLGDLSGIMKTIATPGAHAGASMDKIRELSGSTLMASTIAGIGADQAGREMAQLLEGRAGLHNVLGSRLPDALTGAAGKKFNAESPAQRLETIMKELAKYKDASDAYAHTFTAQFTTLKDNIKYGFLAEATSPLFDRVKQSMEDINRYFDQHKQRVEEITHLVGARLVHGWNEIENIVKRVAPIIGHLADRIEHMSAGELGEKMKHAGELYLGAKVAGMGMSAAGWMLPGAARMGAGLLGGGSAAGIAELGGAAEGLGGAALGAIGAIGGATVALGAIGAVAIVAGGQLSALANTDSKYHADAVQASKDLGAALEHLAQDFRPAEHAVTTWAEHVGTQVTDLFANMLEAAHEFGQGWEATVKHAHYIDRMMDRSEYLDDPRFNGLTRVGETFGTNYNLSALAKDPNAKKKDADAPPKIGTMNVYVTIPGNNDPSRVARLTASAISRLAKNPTKSPLAHDFEKP